MPGASKSALGALAALLLVPSPAVGEYFPDLLLKGACDAANFLNGLRFEMKGRTYTGAPYYKATTRNEYIYWDPDCGGGGDGQQRWIIDDSEPDTTKLRDLDGDGQCNYYARFDSTDKSKPPAEAFWKMNCGGAKAESRLIVLADITTTLTTTTMTTTSTTASTTTISSTSTSSSTTKTSTSTTSSSKTSTTTTVTSTTQTFTGTSSTVSSTTSTTSYTGTSTTRTTSTTTTTLMMLRLTGVCPYKDFLEGLTFVEEGYTASGARWFKSAEDEQYVYHDYDCNGGGNGKKRWIIDENLPDVTQTEDLDQDGACNYHARHDSDDTYGPPTAAVWQIWCGVEWVNTILHLDMVSNYTYDDGMDESNSLKLRSYFKKSCQQKEYMNNLQFEYQGVTASGSPYYKSVSSDEYMYYDPHCSGNVSGSARWVLDSDSPSLTALSDLDGDGNCSYHARAKSKDGSAPPKGSMWKVDCGGVWKDMWVALVRLPTTTTSVTATSTTATTTAAHGDGHAAPAAPIVNLNGAAGPQHRLAFVLLGLLGLLSCQ
mmetsp:Transcript_37526/g.120823  ORF Transcript_37526/g.120823 Transcript_37526/m.120823 type:complete len:542 (-) Transcript_37526:188-1813(-)